MLQDGIRDVPMKPFQTDEIVRAIRAAIDGAGPH